MTIDTARLRALAEAATLNDDPDDWPLPEAVGWDRHEDNQFVAAMSPKLVLALLDRLEAATAYVADPGNWSAYDARRRLLLDILNGEDPR